MKKNTLLFIALGILLVLSGCGWNTSRNQYRDGNWYGILRPEEVASMERQQTAIEYRRKTQELELDKQKMLNEYTKRQLQPTTESATVNPTERGATEEGIGFRGVLKNLSQYTRNGFVIAGKTFGKKGYQLNPADTIYFNLPPGDYTCTGFQNGSQVGSPWHFKVDGQKRYFLGEWVYWGCSKE